MKPKIFLSFISYILIATAIQNCDELSCNCTINAQNIKECSSCRDGYTQDFSNNRCFFDWHKTQFNTIGQNQGIGHCLYQNLDTCSVCAFCYTNWRTSCQYFCEKMGIYVMDHESCKPYCNITYCETCSNDNRNQCIKCDSNSYLYNTQCVTTCPENYIPDSNRECIQCSFPCKQCSSPDVCSVCYQPDITSPPSCKCPGNQVYFNKQCVQACPLYHKLNKTKGTCERLCPSNQYPLYNFDQTSFECVTVSNTSDDFCVQHLKNLEGQVSFKLQKGDYDNYYQLVAKIDQTPQYCYNYLLFGKEVYQIQTKQTLDQSDYIELYFQFNKGDFENTNYVNCNAKTCDLRLKVQWGNKIQYIFKTQINLDVTGISKSEVLFNGDFKLVDVLCENCVIPREMILSSVLEKKCTSDQVCTDNSIYTSINSVITITQKISDPQFVNNILTPHSLKLDYNNNGYQATVYIKSFNYSNNIPGQITYSFIAIGVSGGQITLTSIVKSAKVGRILESSDAKIIARYPQLTFDLQFKDKVNEVKNFNNEDTSSENDSSSTTYIIIIVVLCVFFTAIIIGYCIYQRYKKRNKNLLKSNDNINTKLEQYKQNEQVNIQQCNDLEQSIKVKEQNNLPETLSKQQDNNQQKFIMNNDQIEIEVNKSQQNVQQQIYQQQREIQYTENQNTQQNYQNAFDMTHKQYQNKSPEKQEESENQNKQDNSAAIIILNEEEEDDE